MVYLYMSEVNSQEPVIFLPPCRSRDQTKSPGLVASTFTHTGPFHWPFCNSKRWQLLGHTGNGRAKCHKQSTGSRASEDPDKTLAWLSMPMKPELHLSLLHKGHKDEGWTVCSPACSIQQSCRGRLSCSGLSVPSECGTSAFGSERGMLKLYLVVAAELVSNEIHWMDFFT